MWGTGGAGADALSAAPAGGWPECPRRRRFPCERRCRLTRRRCVGGVAPSSGPGAPGSWRAGPLCSAPTQMAWRCAASWYALTKLLSTRSKASAVRVPDIFVTSAATLRSAASPSSPIPPRSSITIGTSTLPWLSGGYESCFFFSASRIRRLRCASVVSGQWTRVTSMVSGDAGEVHLDVASPRASCASIATFGDLPYPTLPYPTLAL